MTKNYKGYISPSRDKVLKVLKKSSILILSALVVSGFFVLPVLATHTASVSVSTTGNDIYTKGGTAETFSFTVTNNGPDKIIAIYIDVPSGFTSVSSITCPLNWLSGVVGNQVQCAWSPEKTKLLPNESGVVSFSATAPTPGVDTSYDWVITTWDDVVASHSASVSTIVDVTPPTTTDDAPADWVNYDVTVTLTCNDNYEGVPGSGCKETYYSTDGSAPTILYTAPFTLADTGQYQLKYYSIDNVGNSEGVVTGTLVKIDKEKPVTVITSPDAGSWQKADFSVSIADSDTGGSELNYCEYQVKSGGAGNWVITKDWTVRNCSQSVTLTVGSGKDCPDQGENMCKINVRAIDKAGNSNWVFPWNDRMFSIDWTPPTVGTISVEPTIGTYTSPNPTITATITDTDGSGVASCKYTINGTDWLNAVWNPETNTCTAQPTNLKNGQTYQFNIKGIDKAGNEGVGTPVLLTVDATPPKGYVVGITGVDENTGWIKGIVEVTCTGASDGTSGVNPNGYDYEYTFDDNGSNEWTAITGCTNTGSSCSWNTSGLNDAISWVRCRAKDNAGNIGVWDTAKYAGIDNTPPVTSDDTDPNEPWYADDRTVTLTCSDTSGSGCKETKYCVDTTGTCTPDSSYTAPISVTCPANEVCIQYVRYFSTDTVDNTESIKTSYAIKIDKKAPPPPTMDDEPTYTQGTSNTVSWSSVADEGSGNVQYFVQMAKNNAFTGDVVESGWINTTSYEFTELSDGTTYYYRVKAKDAVGNVSDWSNVVSSTQDATPPTTVSDLVSTSHPYAMGAWHTQSQDNTVDISWAPATDGTSGLDGYSIVCDTTSDTVPDTTKDIEETVTTYTCTFSDGTSNYFHIRAVDNVGNWGETAHLGPFYIDTTPPTITDNYEYDGVWVNEAQTVTLTPSDVTSGIKEVKYCQDTDCDPSTGTLLAYPYQLSYTADQITVVRYQAWDNAGNPSEIGEYIVKLDTASPIAMIVINNDETYTSSTQVTLSLTYNDALSGVKECRYSNDGSTWTTWETCVATKNWTLTTGDEAKIVYYEVKDLAGNIGRNADSIILDTTPPTSWTGSLETVTAEANEVEVSFSVCWSGTDAGSGIEKFDLWVKDGKDGGNPWVVWVPSDVSGNCANYSGTIGHTYCFKSRAKDYLGNYEDDKEVGDKGVSCTDVVAFTFEIPLVRGWNLISLPIVPIDRDTEDVLGDIALGSKGVWAYDPLNPDAVDGWLSYAPGVPSNLTTMTAGYGYWIEMANNGTLTVAGTIMPVGGGITPPQRILRPGWNLIGHYGVDSRSAYCALYPIYIQNRWSQPLWGYRNGSFFQVYGRDIMEPGYGYWIAINSALPENVVYTISDCPNIPPSGGE